MYLRGGVGVEHVCMRARYMCGPMYMSVWFHETVFICVCGCVFVVQYVCQVCEDLLICCPELANNWHLLQITSSVKKY